MTNKKKRDDIAAILARQSMPLSQNVEDRRGRPAEEFIRPPVTYTDEVLQRAEDSKALGANWQNPFGLIAPLDEYLAKKQYERN